MTDAKFRLDSFYYRLSVIHSDLSVIRGQGSHSPTLVVVQDARNARAMRFVLKHMSLIQHTFITPLHIVPNLSSAKQSYYLRELIDFLKPDLVVAAGDLAVATLRGRLRGFKMTQYRGRVFTAKDLQREVFPVYAPEDHIDKDADKRIRSSARTDWNKIRETLVDLKIEDMMHRWSETKKAVEKQAEIFYAS